MNKYIDSKLTIKKINMINLLAILPLLISGFYKNGIKLYALGLVNIFGLFKPLIFDILGLVIGMLVPFIVDNYIKHKKRKILSYLTMSNYPYYGLILASIISINTPIYIFLLVIFICSFLSLILKKPNVNIVCLMALLIILIMNLKGNFSFQNIYESTNNFHLNPLDYFMGKGSGGINSNNIILLIISIIILFSQDYYKKEIPLYAFITYFSLILVYGLYKNNIILILDSLFSNSVLFSYVFIASDMKTSPYTKLGKIIYAILIGIITFILYMYYPELAGIGAILIGSLCAKTIDKMVER